MLSSLFEVDVCSLTNAGEQTGTRRKQGGRSGGPVGVPEGPDCTGSTVTACWRGLCGPAGVKRPPATRGKTCAGRLLKGDRAGFPLAF
jgi:hypothetical protein